MTGRWLLAPLTLLLLIGAASGDDKPKADKPAEKPKTSPYKFPGYTTMMMEGFTLFVSDETKSHGEDEKYTRKPMQVVELELQGIVRVMPPKMLKILRTVKVFVEWDDPESKPKNGGPGIAVARYWYDAGRGAGMAMNGRDPKKANNIEILSMRHLTEKWQPSKHSDQIVILHELCHAVHSHLLGNNNLTIKAAFQQAADRGLYDQVKHESGRTAKAYAATNDHEYFAELSCAYLDRCAYFPFTREELKEHDPVGYAMMEQVWGKNDPRLAKPKTVAKAPDKSKTETKSKPDANAKPATKPAGKPAESVAAKPSKSGPEAEATATKALELIQVLVNVGRKDKAREKLQDLIDTYPSTEAARKAKELLKELM
jgi:hypothetical protein